MILFFFLYFLEYFHKNFFFSGVSSPSTKDKFGGEMPSERIVASTVLVDRNDEDQEFTTSVMQWAQFIDHDLTHAPFMSLGESFT